MAKKYVLIAAMAIGLAACSAAQEKAFLLLDKAAELQGKVEDATLGNAASSMRNYCLRVPEASRLKLRSSVNDRPEAGGAKVSIDCSGVER